MSPNRGTRFGAALMLAACFFCNRTPLPKYQFITSEGNPAFSATFTDAHDFSEGLAAVAQDDQWGFIDHEGKSVIAFQFAYATSFRDGFATVTGTGQRMAVIDRDGRVVHPFSQKLIINLGLGWFAVHDPNTNRVAFHDSGGSEKHPPCFEHIAPFREGYAAFTTMDESGFLDESGAVVQIVSRHKPTAGRIGLWLPTAFHEGLCAFWNMQDEPIPITDDMYGLDVIDVLQPAPCGYLDHSGQALITARYLECSPFSEGLAAVRKRERRRIGYLRQDQSWLIQPAFFWAGRFSEGLACVSDHEGLFYLNHKGERAFAAHFEDTPDEQDKTYRDFSDGLAGAKENGVYGYINQKGDWIIPPRYAAIRPFREGLARVQINAP